MLAARRILAAGPDGKAVFIEPGEKVPDWLVGQVSPHNLSDAGGAEPVAVVEDEGTPAAAGGVVAVEGGGGVPSGSASKVLDWVGDDADRAGEALAAERGRKKSRKKLMSDLNEIIG